MRSNRRYIGLGFPRTVDAQLAVAHNLLDEAPLLKVSKSLASERTVDLETVDEGSDGDQAIGLDIFGELIRGLLVEDDGVVGLVLDCNINTLAFILGSALQDCCMCAVVAGSRWRLGW